MDKRGLKVINAVNRGYTHKGFSVIPVFGGIQIVIFDYDNVGGSKVIHTTEEEIFNLLNETENPDTLNGENNE